MKKYGPYLILFAAMLWATDAPFRIHLTNHLSSNFIVLGEHMFDTLMVLPVFILGFSELKKLGWKEWLAVAFIGVAGSALASVAYTQAFADMAPSISPAILLQKLQPLLAIYLAYVVLKERLNPKFWLWAIVALVGAYIISFPSLVPFSYPGEKYHVSLAGVLLALTAAALWGASTVFGKFVLNKISFKLMTALRFIIGLIFLVILNFSAHTFPAAHQVTATDWLFLLIIAIASGVVSLFIYYRGLETTKASVATLAELGFPMAAVIVNWIFIPGSALVWQQIVGIAVLLGAVFMLGRKDINQVPDLALAYEPK
jgi:drug/metabolite transporter (DMT)-like permease